MLIGRKISSGEILLIGRSILPSYIHMYSSLCRSCNEVLFIRAKLLYERVLPSVTHSLSHSAKYVFSFTLNQTLKGVTSFTVLPISQEYSSLQEILYNTENICLHFWLIFFLHFLVLRSSYYI